jgi:DNA helicase II / ATP-dependent DNA helicase PcrA
MLNDKQRKVVFELSGNTIVSASPGSGKTKTLVARAQHKLNSMPSHKSLALITYTNAGADEISYRLSDRDNKAFVGTIHRFCLEFILRPFGWLYGWPKPRIITYDELTEFVELNPDFDLGNSPSDEINKIKKTLDGKLDKNAGWDNAVKLEYVSEAYYSFLKAKKAIDFNEILYRSFKIISENDFVVASLSNKFYEISIDEFQDINIYQYEILKAIHQKRVCTFFMVGDDKQRIYRFAGAIDNAFGKASADFSVPVEILEVTYRSTTNIINAYSSLFENHPVLKNESEFKDTDNKVILKETKKANHDAILEGCINHFVNKAKIDPSEIAILSYGWRDAFDANKGLRNKYNTVGLGALPHRNLNNSTFNLIRCISRFLYSNSVRNLRIIRRAIELHILENNLSINDAEFNFITNTLISKFSRIDRTLTLLNGITELQKIFNSTFRVSHAAFNELVSLLDEGEIHLWTFEKYLETLSGVSGITINTIHQAKGLEYKVVILNQINEGKIPKQIWDGTNKIYLPLTEVNKEDGRTLLYVGISRAKESLIVLHNWKPSMFLSNIEI